MTINTYITSIQNFKYDEEKRINRYWTQLCEFYYKLYTANKNMKQIYSDLALLCIFINQLLKEYTAIRNIFWVQQSISVEEKIKILNEKKLELKQKAEAESAYTAFRSYSSNCYCNNHCSNNSDSSISNTSIKYYCYIYNRGYIACNYSELLFV